MNEETMKPYDRKQRNAGFYCFFVSGICAISSGIVVSLLQEQYGFDYGITGTLLSLMNIGNLIAGFATGILPGKIGMKKTVGILTVGYLIGYGAMAWSGWLVLLMAAFFMVGMAKGSTINTCTILIGDNSRNRTQGMNLMHACYALGALFCPFIISAAGMVSEKFPMLVLGLIGGTLWLTFAMTAMGSKKKEANASTDWSFLTSKKFWLLTALVFCQNAVEVSVTGWMVTYFKGSGILTGILSTYTVTVMWMATLILRMMYAFVFPIKRAETAMIKMGIGCAVFYFLLMQANGPWTAIVLLFAFAASMAGMNPTAVACAGRMTSVTSMGVMLPAASSGAILMPWVIGIVAEHAGIKAGMICNIVPCVGMLVLSCAAKKMAEKEVLY
ncbi:MAG: MFS transporter [Brotaphodocola sp.]